MKLHTERRTNGTTIIVTRHAALAQYLVEEGIVPSGTPYIPHATVSDVAGRRVAGTLPLHLVATAASIVHVPLDAVPFELRDVELSIEQVRRYAGPVQEFSVRGVHEVRGTRLEWHPPAGDPSPSMPETEVVISHHATHADAACAVAEARASTRLVNIRVVSSLALSAPGRTT